MPNIKIFGTHKIDDTYTGRYYCASELKNVILPRIKELHITPTDVEVYFIEQSLLGGNINVIIELYPRLERTQEVLRKVTETVSKAIKKWPFATTRKVECFIQFLDEATSYIAE